VHVAKVKQNLAAATTVTPRTSLGCNLQVTVGQRPPHWGDHRPDIDRQSDLELRTFQVGGGRHPAGGANADDSTVPAAPAELE